jgi:hypothetical protein
LQVLYTMHHVLYHHSLTNCCAVRCVYQLAWSFPLLHVVLSMDTIVGEPQISLQHIRWLRALSSFLLKVPSAPPAKIWQTNPLFDYLMEWGCCSGCLYHDESFLVVCEGLIVYVNLVVSVLVSEYFLAIFVPDTILGRYFLRVQLGIICSSGC